MKKFSTIKSLVGYMVVFSIVTVIVFSIVDISKVLATWLSIIIYMIIILTRFNHYKIAISSKEIILFKIFSGKIKIPIPDIIEIEIGRSETVNKVEGTKRYMYIRTSTNDYRFNIYELESDSFYNYMEQFTFIYGISFMDVKSD